MDSETVSFDRPMLERLRAACEAATEDVFEFEGRQYVKAYAQYLIEYLDAELPKKSE